MSIVWQLFPHILFLYRFLNNTLYHHSMNFHFFFCFKWTHTFYFLSRNESFWSTSFVSVSAFLNITFILNVSLHYFSWIQIWNGIHDLAVLWHTAKYLNITNEIPRELKLRLYFCLFWKKRPCSPVVYSIAFCISFVLGIKTDFS